MVIRNYVGKTVYPVEPRFRCIGEGTVTGRAQAEDSVCRACLEKRGERVTIRIPIVGKYSPHGVNGEHLALDNGVIVRGCDRWGVSGSHIDGTVAELEVCSPSHNVKLTESCPTKPGLGV